MPSARTFMVTSCEIEPGLRVAASWDGGRMIAIHLDRDGITRRVAFWPIWNPAWESPLIMPTIDSFERFVRGRLDEPGVIEQLVDPATA